MNKQRKTSHILNVFQYDETTGAVTLPSTLVLTAPASNDNSTKVGTTAWVRTYVTGLSYLTGNQSITVSGDAWGNIVGKRPSRTTDQTEEDFAPILAEFETRLEIERQKVDRIAFSGQVPVNVTGSTVGDYIIPISTEYGKITGQAITNPSFEQYKISVGKVWKIMEDGRAFIAVKIG